MDMKGLDVNHHLIDFICLTINTVDEKWTPYNVERVFCIGFALGQCSGSDVKVGRRKYSQGIVSLC